MRNALQKSEDAIIAEFQDDVTMKKVRGSRFKGE
jgi:hypothetical protein